METKSHIPTWDGFMDALKSQFVDVDAENTARTKIESMTQGVKSFMDYWNEFKLMAMEAIYDDKTMQRLLLRGSNRVILDAWAQDNRQVVDVDDLAQRVIEKENRIKFVKSLHKTPTASRTVNTPRNPDWTYRPTNSNKQNHGNRMIKAKNPREIYLADGKPSAMGHVTHLMKVPMDISNHRELATSQVVNLL